MKNIYYTYKYLHPITNEIIYFGKGKNDRCRLTKYENHYLINVFNKYGFVNYEKIEENLSEEEAFTFEKAHIAVFKALNGRRPTGNFSDGGEGSSGYIHTEEMKKYLSDKLKGIPKTPEHNRKNSEAQLGPKNHRYGKPSTFKGKTHTDKAKQKIRESRLGKTQYKPDKSQKLKIAISHGAKPFGVYSKNTGDLVAEYTNQSECARELGLESWGINKCLKNKQEYHRGYIFKYLE